MFFFKQKTAYEVRISDWSSDVGSSDLPDERPRGQCDGLEPAGDQAAEHRIPRAVRIGVERLGIVKPSEGRDLVHVEAHGLAVEAPSHGEILEVERAHAASSVPVSGRRRRNVVVWNFARSEERRVGKECVSTCRSRWAPYHSKKNTQNHQNMIT